MKILNLQMDNQSLNQIRTEIANGHLDVALDLLLPFSQEVDEDSHNDALLLSSRFNKLHHDHTLGVVSAGFYTRERNKISSALLDLVKNLQKMEPRD